MLRRNQFTFYISFYEIAQRIKGKAARADFYDVICRYALYGEEPDLEKLSQMGAICFISAKPNLATGRRKALSGEKGGSKPKRNGIKAKQAKTEKEKEKEVEIEEEKEIEKEIEIETEIEIEGKAEAEGFPPEGMTRLEMDCDFEIFWDLYPVKIGRDRAWDAFRGRKEPLEVILRGLRLWKDSPAWKREDGRFIPRAAKFLQEGYFLEKPERKPLNGARGDLGVAEMEAIAQLMGDL